MWADVRFKEMKIPGIIVFVVFSYPLIENGIRFDADGLNQWEILDRTARIPRLLYRSPPESFYTPVAGLKPSLLSPSALQTVGLPVYGLYLFVAHWLKLLALRAQKRS